MSLDYESPSPAPSSLSGTDPTNVEEDASPGMLILARIITGETSVDSYIPAPTEYDPQQRTTGQVSKKSHAKKRSKEHIARPGNAFLQFRSDFIAQEIIPHRLEKSNAVLSKIVGAVWRRLSPAQREPWRNKAESEKKEHERMYPEYHYGHQTGAGFSMEGVALPIRTRRRHRTRNKKTKTSSPPDSPAMPVGNSIEPPFLASALFEGYHHLVEPVSGLPEHLTESCEPCGFNGIGVVIQLPDRRSSSCPPPNSHLLSARFSATEEEDTTYGNKSNSITGSHVVPKQSDGIDRSQERLQSLFSDILHGHTALDMHPFGGQDSTAKSSYARLTQFSPQERVGTTFSNPFEQGCAPLYGTGSDNPHHSISLPNFVAEAPHATDTTYLPSAHPSSADSFQSYRPPLPVTPPINGLSVSHDLRTLPPSGQEVSISYFSQTPALSPQWVQSHQQADSTAQFEPTTDPIFVHHFAHGATMFDFAHGGMLEPKINATSDGSLLWDLSCFAHWPATTFEPMRSSSS